MKNFLYLEIAKTDRGGQFRVGETVLVKPVFQLSVSEIDGLFLSWEGYLCDVISPELDKLLKSIFAALIK